MSEYDLLSLAALSRVGGGTCTGAIPPMLPCGRDGGMLCMLVNEPRLAYDVSLTREA